MAKSAQRSFRFELSDVERWEVEARVQGRSLASLVERTMNAAYPGVGFTGERVPVVEPEVKAAPEVAPAVKPEPEKFARRHAENCRCLVCRGTK